MLSIIDFQAQPVPNLHTFFKLTIFPSWTERRQPNILCGPGRQSHPLPHRLDNLIVPVHSGVDTLLPLAILPACVPTHIIPRCLAIRHTLGAGLAALGILALRAVWVSVREAVGSSGFNERVGRQDQLDLPVAVCSGEHLDLEVSVLVEVLFLDENGSGVAHIPWGASWELIIMAVQLNGIPFRRNGPSTQRELFGIVRLPNFHFIDVIITQPCTLHKPRKALAEVVRVVLAHQQILLTTDDDFEVSDEVVGDRAAEVGLELGQNGGEVGWRDVLGGVDTETGEAHAQ